MNISIASDHAGFEQKTALAAYLRELGHRVTDLGPDNDERVDYPDFAALVARDVAAGAAERGVLVCGTGIGMAVAANKVQGIRAANVVTPEFAALAREHNDANVVGAFRSLRGRGDEPPHPGRVPLHRLRRRAPCGPRREDRRARESGALSHAQQAGDAQRAGNIRHADTYRAGALLRHGTCPGRCGTKNDAMHEFGNGSSGCFSRPMRNRA